MAFAEAAAPGELTNRKGTNMGVTDAARAELQALMRKHIQLGAGALMGVCAGGAIAIAQGVKLSKSVFMAAVESAWDDTAPVETPAVTERESDEGREPSSG